MHSQQPPGVVQNWSTLQCSKHDIEQCGYDHAPVTRGRMRTQFPLPHGPSPPPPSLCPGEAQTGRGLGPVVPGPSCSAPGTPTQYHRALFTRNSYQRGGGGLGGGGSQRGCLFKLDLPSAKFWVKILFGWVSRAKSPPPPPLLNKV